MGRDRRQGPGNGDVILLAQTTRPVWTPEGLVLVLTCIALVLLPALGTLITIIFNKLTELRATNRVQGEIIQQQHEKINELAEKNAADVAPLPPMPMCPPPVNKE